MTEHSRAVDEVAEEIIGEWRDANPLAVTTNQVARGINWTPDSRSISRITTVLKQRGDTRSSTRGHTGGSRTWVWTPSPRVRGSPNTQPFRICPADDAIHACAGEAFEIRQFVVFGKGLSPVCGGVCAISARMRGVVEFLQACEQSVYPRVCGEAFEIRLEIVFHRKGLSPRVRGSLFVPRIPFRQGGSIGHGKGSYPVG